MYTLILITLYSYLVPGFSAIRNALLCPSTVLFFVTHNCFISKDIFKDFYSKPLVCSPLAGIISIFQYWRLTIQLQNLGILQTTELPSSPFAHLRHSLNHVCLVKVNFSWCGLAKKFGVNIVFFFIMDHCRVTSNVGFTIKYQCLRGQKIYVISIEIIC